jgi:predicted nucleic acid-binding protein
VIGYADTSFLVSLYAVDSSSAVALSALVSHPMPLAFTEWHEFEAENALELREFRGRSTAAETAAALDLLRQNLQAGQLQRIYVDHSAALARARGLASLHAAKLGTRALDILHVALAIELKADEFLTFDQRTRAPRRESLASEFRGSVLRHVSRGSAGRALRSGQGKGIVPSGSILCLLVDFETVAKHS